MFLGIDFGTSFSQVSTMYLGQPLLLLNPGEYGIPSEFYYDRDCGILIGQDALDAGQGEAAANLVTEVKMAILSGKSFVLDGKTFSAKDIIKEIYKTLILKAVQVAKKRSINTNIEGIVISVPAKFGMQERGLIAEAARECLGTTKVPIRAIIKEPVAAAISYYNTELEDNKYILVYDLGGGTCDVALVRSDSSSAEHYTVVDSDMVRLGGRNWDEELVKYITQIIENKSGIRIKGNVGYEEKIRRTAITVKHDLSDPTKSRSIARVELNGRIYTTPISKTVFDEITAHLLRQTLDCLQDVYDKHSISCKIDEIICVGGSSNMLQVEEGLLKRFPKCKIRLYEPEHAVVNGATIYANMPQINVLKDVASFSYGTDSNTHYGYPDNKEIISNIIFKGSKLPVTQSKGYCPTRDGQEVVAFRIFESEYMDDEYDRTRPEKRFIGTVELRLPPNSKKDLSLRCQLSLNAEGMLEVTASEPSGKRVMSTFKLQAL
ncbi:Hsp70 family protein [Blautia sp. HCP3S3_G3]|uniref:Hsp70 family protein n=1 Tax=Blautia sp. HCP3S3_G3 TaxID=3438913 RepID=UPI003F8A68D9